MLWSAPMGTQVLLLRVFPADLTFSWCQCESGDSKPFLLSRHTQKSDIFVLYTGMNGEEFGSLYLVLKDYEKERSCRAAFFFRAVLGSQQNRVESIEIAMFSRPSSHTMIFTKS